MRKSNFSLVVLLLLAVLVQKAAAQNEADFTIQTTAEPGWDRMVSWGLALTADTILGDFVVTEGRERDLLLRLAATRYGVSEYQYISGEACIANHSDQPLTGFSVSIAIGEGGAELTRQAVDSSVSTVIEPGEQACFPWSIDIFSWFQPGRTYYAEAHLESGGHAVHSTQASASFPASAPQALYESITVNGPGGRVWTLSDSAVKEFKETYTCAETGPYTYEASIAETGNVAQAWVQVVCSKCVRSAAYWKNHSSASRQPHPAWALVGEGTPFRDSGLTWLEMMWASSKGDEFYTLAQEYIAANLNIAGGVYEDYEINRITRNAGMVLSSYFNDPSSDDSRPVVPGLIKALRDLNGGKWSPARCTGQE